MKALTSLQKFWSSSCLSFLLSAVIEYRCVFLHNDRFQGWATTLTMLAVIKKLTFEWHDELKAFYTKVRKKPCKLHVMYVLPLINVSVWQAPKWISVGSLFTLQIIFGTQSMQRNNSLKCSVSGGVRHLLEGHQGLWGGTKDQARKGQYIFLEGYANIWHHLWYMILAPTMMQFITLVMRKKSTTTWFFPFLLMYYHH